ncbi:hypothetical protein D8S78_16150 [Natrialba swarupiae]|nr:hypothetical protein [Natrialba swarupiae]
MRTATVVVSLGSEANFSVCGSASAIQAHTYEFDSMSLSQVTLDLVSSRLLNYRVGNLSTTVLRLFSASRCSRCVCSSRSRAFSR